MLFEWIRHWIAAPVFEDIEKTRTASVLNTILVTLTGIAIIILLAFMLLIPGFSTRPLISLLTLLLLDIGMRVLLLRGHIQAAAVGLIGGLWLAATALTITGGGIRIPGSSLYIVPVLIAFLIYGPRVSIGLTVLTLLVQVIFVRLEMQGGLLPPLLEVSLSWTWLTQTGIMIAIVSLFFVATQYLRRALQQTQRQERLLEERNLALKLEINEREVVEEAYKTLVEHSLQGLFIFQNGRLVFANQALADMTGYTVAELLGFDNILQIVHPDDAQLIADQLKSDSIETEFSTRMEFRLIRKDGLTRCLEVFAVLITYQDAPAIQTACMDITERKQAAVQLQRTADLLRAVIESAANGTLVIDENTLVITANQRFLNLWQLPPSWVDLPDRKSGLLEMAQRTKNPDQFLARSNELLNNFEIEATDLIELKNGTIVQRQAAPYRVNGQTRGRIYTYLDVTERVHNEQMVRFYSEFKSLITSISTELINLPVEQLDEAIDLTLQRIGQFVGVDRSFMSIIYGQPPRIKTSAFWAAENVEPLIFDEPLATFEAQFPWLFSRLRSFEHIVIPHLDDMPAEASAEKEALLNEGIQSVLLVPLIFNNNLIGYVGYDTIRTQRAWSENIAALLRIVGEIIANALERKRSDEALRASEEMFRSLTANSPIGIFMADEQFRFIYVNEAYCQATGYTPDELIGQDCQIVLPEEDRPILMERYQQRQRGENLPVRYEARLLRKDGTVFWTEASVKVILDSNGAVRTIGLNVDLTDRKQAEAHRLELALEKEKLDLLRQFIGNVSHDLKTPLANINTSLYLLSRSSDPIQQHAKLDAIKTQTDRLESLIQNLLTISRLDYIPRLELRPVALVDLLTELTEQFRAIIEKKNLAIQLQYDSKLQPVLADRSELSRALGNLIENAALYTPEGGSITVRAMQEMNKIVINIADTGIGIDKADLPYIFNRFYRSTEARHAVGTGSGLGLAIVKKVIEMHEGLISVESTVGQGTTFRIELPTVHAWDAPLPL